MKFNITKEVFIKKLFAILIGNLFCAMAFVLLLRPNQLISGGVTGLSALLDLYLPIPIGLILFLLNLPPMILGIMYLDMKFMFFSTISIFLISFYVGVLDSITASGFIITKDVLLSCIFGGVLNGIGMGITLRNGCSTGGLDIIGAIIKKKYSISVGNVLMIINFFIIMLSSFIYSLDRALYTLVALFIAYRVMDKIHLGVGKQKQVFIISEHDEKIVNSIYSNMNRGMTYIYGEGAYSHNKFKIIYMICTPIEVVKVKSIINKIDKGAFVAVSDTSDIQGHGFRYIEI
ncbi:MAG: YitT family protein [Peptoniphilus sp.]|uniref:YitT family protein n=1 Tax=Peptoniphilus sp. TaxID=1971214 RepID=UPI002A7593C8|nr:YitT family protein [Peptoniphilus sp.]MDY2986072.1 YitT family protein [Peptoniphilus sp.]